MPESIEFSLADLSPDERGEYLSRVLRFLQNVSAPPEPHPQQKRYLDELLLRELNPTSRKNLLFILRETRHRLHRRSLAEPVRWTPERTEAVYDAIAERKLRTAISSRWHDHVLSTPGHTIPYQRYGKFLITQDIIRFVTQGAQTEDLQKIGWISFDVNGLKSLIDCTSHQNGCSFLQGIAKVLLDRQSTTYQWLSEDREVEVTPMTAGGDEFAVLLKAPIALSPESLTEIMMRYQQEIAMNEELQQAINFNSPQVLMRYGYVEKDQQKKLNELLPDSRSYMLQTIRDELPETFIPTISGGAATLDEGMLFALQRQDNHRLRLDDESETFDTAAQKITLSLLAVADARQYSAKTDFKANLEKTNPKLADFFRRNKENRELAQRLRLKRERIQNLLNELGELRQQSTTKE